MKSLSYRSHRSLIVGFGILAAVATGCGKKDATSGGTLVKSNPLAGTSQGYIQNRGLFYAENMMNWMLGIQPAYATVSAFTTFKVCVSEVVYELLSGTAGASSTPLKPGLLDFSPTNTAAMNIGYLDVAAGSVLKNIKFTIATNPTLCGGANYAVMFNAPTTGGDKLVTQDMSFAFNFAAAGYTVGSGDITLFLGNIVNGMAALGAGLDNSTIQTVNVGQAQ